MNQIKTKDIFLITMILVTIFFVGTLAGLRLNTTENSIIQFCQNQGDGYKFYSIGYGTDNIEIGCRNSTSIRFFEADSYDEIQAKEGTIVSRGKLVNGGTITLEMEMIK